MSIKILKVPDEMNGVENSRSRKLKKSAIKS